MTLRAITPRTPWSELIVGDVLMILFASGNPIAFCDIRSVECFTLDYAWEDVVTRKYILRWNNGRKRINMPPETFINSLDRALLAFMKYHLREGVTAHV